MATTNHYTSARICKDCGKVMELELLGMMEGRSCEVHTTDVRGKGRCRGDELLEV